MNENMRAAADQAEELMPKALSVFGGLMEDSNQPGPVRVAAAKATIDYGLKLAERKDIEAGTLEKLDALFADFRKSVGACPQPPPPAARPRR